MKRSLRFPDRFQKGWALSLLALSLGFAIGIVLLLGLLVAELWLNTGQALGPFFF